MISKIQDTHKAKLACVYLRQSTMGQVRHNQESTERQYALKAKAIQLGWPQSAIKVLDADLGLSGSEATKREDFKTLVADVSMNKVGAVFALEASRLSRSCTDWHRLLELCSLTSTLIIDEDGCYNPADFNDQLLLGLKGTMSQAELHFIRARLQGGKVNKAKKGELRFPLPIGLCEEDGNTVLDSNAEVRGVTQLIFDKFEEFGSAFGVVRYFSRHQIKFPKRAYGGIWKGKVIWGLLTHSRIVNMIKNPAYAGTYVYGRHKLQKRLDETGKIKTGSKRLAMPDWQIVIKDHHPGYLSWDRYLENQAILEKNRTNIDMDLLNGPAREGNALFQGLLVCSICGHRLSMRYSGKSASPNYVCTWQRRNGVEDKSCMWLRSDFIDGIVSKRILEIIQPEQLKIAISALDELQQRQNKISKQWEMKIQRFDYEAQLAQKRYEEVDPSNRLVAATLEQRWNDALVNLTEVREQYTQYQTREAITATEQQRQQILSLAQDLPALWQSESTTAKDRKRIVRLLIKDITIELAPERVAILHIRWQGGASEDLKIIRPQRTQETWKASPETVKRVRELISELDDSQIASKFNEEGLKTNRGRAFTKQSIQWIRHKNQIPGQRYQRHQRPGMLSVKQVMQKFGVSSGVVHYWISRNVIDVQRINGLLVISINPQKEAELYELVKNSTRMNKPITSTTHIEGGAL